MSRKPNRWKGLVIGVVSSAAGLAAMDAYWQKVAPKLRENVDLGGKDAYPDSLALDDISVKGQQTKEDEGSTAALGRMIYQSVTGKEPETEETKELLSYLVHWGYGLMQGGVYGTWFAGNGRSPNLLNGTAFATGLWLLGDELTVPMLGLQEGPTAVDPQSHLNRLGAHLAYGLTTAVTGRLLHAIL
jgi:hypothetical protein